MIQSPPESCSALIVTRTGVMGERYLIEFPIRFWNTWPNCAQLGHVFQNLIGNSIKYRSPMTPVRVTISAEQDSGGDWIIRVRDNGIGIAKNDLEKVFQPFKRLHGYE